MRRPIQKYVLRPFTVEPSKKNAASHRSRNIVAIMMVSDAVYNFGIGCANPKNPKPQIDLKRNW